MTRPAVTEPDLPDLPDHQEVMALLQLSSRLDRGSLTARQRPRRPDWSSRGATAVPAVAAPAPGRPVEELQRGRTSVRTYAPLPVPVEVLAAVVADAGQFDVDAWGDDAAGSGLQLLVAARHVAGLPQGLYAANWRAACFSRLAPLPSGAAAADLVLQLEYTDAPAIVIVCGSLAASLDRHGDHGHRLLLARAGAATHAGWLAALDHGLAGSVFAGFLAAALRPLAAVDGWDRTQLLALSVGYPVTDDVADSTPGGTPPPAAHPRTPGLS